MAPEQPTETAAGAGIRRPVLIAVLVGTLTALLAQAWIWTLPPQNTFASLDQFFLFYPAHTYMGRELAAGRLPRWNPFLGLGIAEGADSQFGLFYPPNLLFALLPPQVAMQVVPLTHVALGAAGGFLLARTLGLRPLGATTVAIALGAGRMLHHLISWPPMLATFAGLGKRRGEAMLLGEDAVAHRAVLADYPLPILDLLLGMAATTALVCYAMYVVSVHNSTAFLVTILPVTYGVSRYLGLVARGVHGGDPGEILSRDAPLILAVVVWACLCVMLLYADA